jgi:phosphoribosylformylglycinamidine synthase
MQFLVLTGDAAYTASEANKIKNQINKSGSANVESVSATWIHYAYLEDNLSRDAAQVSTHLQTLFRVYFVFCSLSPIQVSSRAFSVVVSLFPFSSGDPHIYT